MTEIYVKCLLKTPSRALVHHLMLFAAHATRCRERFGVNAQRRRLENMIDNRTRGGSSYITGGGGEAAQATPQPDTRGSLMNFDAYI